MPDSLLAELFMFLDTWLRIFAFTTIITMPAMLIVIALLFIGPLRRE